MKKKRLLILMIQLLAVVGFAYASYNYTQNLIKPAQVYQFVRNIPANQEIKKEDLKVVTIPANAIQSNFARSFNGVFDKSGKETTLAIKGKFTATDVYANQYVIKEQLITLNQLDPFKTIDLSRLRKISISIGFDDSFSGNVKKGDAVDLVFTGTGTKSINNTEKEYLYSKVFMQNVLVYNVGTEDGFYYSDRSQLSKNDIQKQTGSTPGSQEITTNNLSDKIGVITLAVDMQQAEEITARLKAGSVRIIGRFDKSQSYDTLGYIVGDYAKKFAAPANAETGFAPATK